MRFILTTLFASGILASGGSLLQEAPGQAAARVNPMRNDQRAARAGAKLYAKECAACHGRNREGAKGIPPLNWPGVSQAPAGALFWALRNGSLKHGMPSFASLPEPERWQIITFLQSSAQ